MGHILGQLLVFRVKSGLGMDLGARLLPEPYVSVDWGGFWGKMLSLMIPSASLFYLMLPNIGNPPEVF
eukprot:7352012-Pyramimonas_sp.AAC.1